jgi:hypothetical protein
LLNKSVTCWCVVKSPAKYCPSPKGNDTVITNSPTMVG